jgi:hypothetical protein
MKRSTRIVILAVAGLLAIVAVIATIFGKRRPVPAPEVPAIGQPQQTPRRVFGIAPLSSFPISLPTPAGTPETGEPHITPSPSPSPPLPSPSLSLPTYPVRSPAPPPTSEQVFNFLWPKEYRDYLAYLQDALIAEGAIPRENRLSLQTEDEVLAFLVRGVDYLAEKRFITETEAANFRNGIQHDLRNIKTAEYQYYLQFAPQYPSPSPLPIPSPPFIIPSPRTEQPMTLGRALLAILTGAYRQLYAQGECYIVRKPFWPIPGVNLWAPACRGFMGKAPIGCLDAVCPVGNAIWDPVTGICGCD